MEVLGCTEAGVKRPELFPVVTRLGSGTVKGQHLVLKTTNRFHSAEAQSVCWKAQATQSHPLTPKGVCAGHQDATAPGLLGRVQ